LTQSPAALFVRARRSTVAVLTTKIAYLTEHIKKNRNDLHSRRGLEIMVAQRRRLLKYLRSQSMQRYGNLIRKLGIRAM